MQTMYPGMPNSPQTELAADITADATTIPLLNAAALPPAPNLAVIGTDEMAETVLYTGIEGNNLTGVTRGFQGTARSWSAGAKVARNFTAYDYDALRQNIQELEASKASIAHGEAHLPGGADPIPYATETEGGLMSAEDKRKLSSISMGIKFRDIPEPFYIAHRGGANIFPENTMEAYEGCLALGINMIEQDCRKMLDGSLAVMHDATVDRITDKTGNVSDFTTMAWKNLNVTGVLPGWKDVPAVLFDEVLQRFGTRAIYVPESKDRACVPEIVAALKRHNLIEYALIQSFNLGELQAAVNEGIPAMFLTSNENTPPQTIKDAGVEYVGVSTTVSDAYISSLINAGLKVVVWTVNHRYQRDHYLSLGVSGFFSDDPLYLSGRSPVLRRDPFATQMYYHGHLAPPAGLVDSSGLVFFNGRRGEFYPPNKFGWKNVGFRRRDGVILGWAGELQGAFSVRLDITYEALADGDGNPLTRWGSIAVCWQKDFYSDNFSPEDQGYHILQRLNGVLEVFRVDGKYDFTSLGTFQGSEISIGQTVTLEITVTPTQITATRVGEGSVTVDDTTYRGGYLALGTNYIDTTFSNITITEL